MGLVGNNRGQAMRRRVVITGMGVITPLGHRVDRLFRALLEGQSGVGPITHFDASRFPTQFDYSDYRDVNGIKVPFRWTIAWLDGRENIELKDVKVNVPIDAKKFEQPPAPAGK